MYKKDKAGILWWNTAYGRDKFTPRWGRSLCMRV